MDPTPVEKHWMMDKRIPIAVIVTMLVQTSVIIWWAARLDSRVGTLESFRTESSISRGVDSSVDQAQSERLVRLETQFGAIDRALSTIETKIDQLRARQ